MNEVFTIQDAADGDFPELLRLNHESVHFLSPLTTERLRSLHSMAWHRRVIGAGPAVSGFLLAMREGKDYDSPNYRWFAARYTEFLYVDRVVIDAAARGQRLGVRLYEDLFAHARAAQLRRITCEFDIDPPNEASRQFHERFGFREVGRQRVADGRKTVSLQEAVL
jgi:predicted GNAT superfamily acetyltransferase